MSAHSTRSKGRHPDPTTFARERYSVGHVTFEVIDHPTDGATFALIAGEASDAAHRRPLFTGFVSADMPAQLRALADRIDAICSCAVGVD